MFLRLRHVSALVLGLLWVGCSFVRDADRFSEGSGALADGGGSGGSGGWGNCKADGEICTSSGQCCFGACVGDVCSCSAQDFACDQNEDCCSDVCANQKCGPCGAVGAPCGDVGQAPCCRGRACVEDAAATSLCQVSNACPSFATKLEVQDVHQILTSCSQGDAGSDCANWNPEDRPTCYKNCVASKLAITDDCASCYADWWLTCLGAQCVTLGCQASYSAECSDCCNTVCLERFKQCTGFATCPVPP